MSTSSDRAQRLADRTALRATIRDKKRKEAEEFKDEGNKHFREERYHEAVDSYERAIITYGPRTVYLNNLAAAYLKINRYEDAENAAEQALMRDPKLNKARYRRALARKGQGHFIAAAADLIIVIRRDPSCQEAVRELVAIEASGGLEDDEYVGFMGSTAEDFGSPFPDSVPVGADGAETPMLSETSDFEHEGNSIPCRFYNHDGCRNGTECKFRHGPDNRSVRDSLGRNVCLFYVYNTCKFPETRCVYAHDKTYLPPGPWNHPDLAPRLQLQLVEGGVLRSGLVLEKLAAMLKPAHPIKPESFLPRVRSNELVAAAMTLADGLLGRGASSSGSTRGRGRGSRSGKGRRQGRGRANKSHSDPFNDAELEREMDERGKNCGFTDAEAFELMCQGVKPWDDDAWDVLDALESM